MENNPDTVIFVSGWVWRFKNLFVLSIGRILLPQDGVQI